MIIEPGSCRVRAQPAGPVHTNLVNYPAQKGAASCFIELASKRAYAISTGVDYSVWAVPALQQIVHSGCLVLATQIFPISRNEKKKLSSRNVFQEGRLRFHPCPEGGVFPLRPLHPRKINTPVYPVSCRLFEREKCSLTRQCCCRTTRLPVAGSCGGARGWRN